MKPLCVITEERLADIETPVSAYLKLCRGRADSFLLESAETHETVGRYSIIAFDPATRLELWPGQAVVTNGQGPVSHPAEDFFPLIRKIVADHACPGAPGVPAVGSLMGFIGYDAIRLIERLGPMPETDLPVSRLVFPSRFVIFDHQRRTMTLAALAETEADCRAKNAETQDLLTNGFALRKPSGKVDVVSPDPAHYGAMVEKAKEYIRDGEIFQAVLADRFVAETDVEPIDVYRRLRVKSPSPYMFFLDFGDYQIFGASPETMVKVSGDRVFLRPIAGTRGRSADPLRDRALEEELKASEKERAEHVMLVDLGRNDVGRVSRYGSIEINPYMTVERYSHVMHLVSQVEGRLKDGVDQVDAFMAGFPAGTVSGAPKIRAMQIIDELEQTPRGPYAGAVGYFGQNNDMDTCIAIRMMLSQNGRYTIPVGAGIVADSIPKGEYKEIQNKAAQSLAALQLAAGGAL